MRGSRLTEARARRHRAALRGVFVWCVLQPMKSVRMATQREHLNPPADMHPIESLAFKAS